MTRGESEARQGDGKVNTFSAICPHMKGFVAWNASEMSWDCPIHGSLRRLDWKVSDGPGYP